MRPHRPVSALRTIWADQQWWASLYCVWTYPSGDYGGYNEPRWKIA